MECAIDKGSENHPVLAEEELSIENIMNAVRRIETKGAGARISEGAWGET